MALESGAANTKRLVGEDEWKCKTATGIRGSWLLARALPRELAHAFGRLQGRYDTAVAHPRRLPQDAGR